MVAAALVGYGQGDKPLFSYTGFWVLENLTPILVPGFWLHQVVNALRRPFAWQRDGRKTSWVTRTLEYTAPWTLTLFLAGSITLFLVSNQIGSSDVTPAAWEQVHSIAAASPVLRWLVLAMCVLILVSIGFAVRHARQAWQLEQAIRRHTSTPEDAERLLSGRVNPSGQKIVSLVIARMTNFADASRALQPTRLINWLNTYFDCLANSASRYGGLVDHLDVRETLLVFGLRSEDCHANSALLCLLEIQNELSRINQEFSKKNLPRFTVAVGAHTGQVVAGEVGSQDRRHYTVVGGSLDLAVRVAHMAESPPDQSCFGLLSRSCMREAGLLMHSPEDQGLVESQFVEEDGGSLPLYSIVDFTQFGQALAQASQRSV